MTYKDYFKLEAVRGTCTLDTCFKFGLNNTDKKAIVDISDDNELNEIEGLTVHYLTLSQGNTPLDSLQCRFFMINGLPLYWMFGLVTSAAGASPPYVISNFTTRNKPSIAVYLEGDNAMKTYAKGLVAQQLTMTFEIGMPSILAQMSFMGMTHGISTATPTATYPDTIESGFNRLTHWKWNTVAFSIKAWSINVNHKLTGLIGDDGYYQTISENAPIRSIITVNFMDGVDVTTIMADKRAFTARTLELKMGKSVNSNLYWTWSASCLCLAIQKVRMVGAPDQMVGIFWVTGAVTNTIDDGITTDAHYGF
jgi:hypothetical protein